MGLLTFNWQTNLKYVLMYWIIDITFRLLERFKKNWFDYFQDKEDAVPNEYMKVIYMNVADLLSGFLALYVYKSSKSQKPKEEEVDKDIKAYLIYEEINPIQQYSKLKVCIMIFFISLLEYLSNSFYWIGYAITSSDYKSRISPFFQKNLTLSLDICMRYILSIFALKTVIYKHGKFSIFLMLIAFIILLTADLLRIFVAKEDDEVDKSKTFFYTGILLLKGISVPFEHLLIKKLYLNYYILPEYLQFARGLTEMVILVLMTTILYYSFESKLNTLYEKINYNIYVYIWTIVLILSFCFKNYILVKFIYVYSVQQVSFLFLAKCFGGSIYGIIMNITNDKDSDADDISLIVMEILAIFIALFATFVYDEIIIINKWDLNKNVKLNISKRGELDKISMEKIEDGVPLIAGLNPDEEEGGFQSNTFKI